MNNFFYTEFYESQIEFSDKFLKKLEDRFGLEYTKNEINCYIYTPLKKIEFSILGNSVLILKKNYNSIFKTNFLGPQITKLKNCSNFKNFEFFENPDKFLNCIFKKLLVMK